MRIPKSRKDKSKKKIIIIINVILYNLVNLNEQIKLKREKEKKRNYLKRSTIIGIR